MKKFKFNKVSIIVLAIAFTLGLGGIVVALAPGAIDLGTADSFAVLAGSGITNVPTSVIVGSAGSSLTPSNDLTEGEVTGGTNYTALDAVVTAAKVALSTAYADAANQSTHHYTTQYPPIKIFSTPTTLTAGVYNDPSSFQITSTLTLDGENNPNAVFIFQAGSTLNFTGGTVALINGAQACNVFWQVGSSATFTAAATINTIKGTILAQTSISDAGGIGDADGAIVSGRLLAIDGAVALHKTQVTVPTCVVPHLTVIKHVSGGPSSVHASDFTTTISGVNTTGQPATGVESPGVDNILTSLGDYTVTEGSHTGYTATYEGCTGTVSLESPTHTCTITNTYQTPKLTLDKIVDNSAGGTAPESTWTLRADDGPTPFSGPGATDSADVVSDASFLDGTYTLSESGTPTNYTASAWSCLTRTGTPVTVTDASVIIAPGDDVICTITNTYIPPVVRHSSSGSIPRVVAPIFAPSITILSTPVVAHIIPKLPKTGFPTASTLGQQVKTIESNLRKGSNGGNVITLQQFLISENKGGKAIALKDFGVDGKFGPITEAALAEWQTTNVLIGDGIFGQKTRAYLGAHY